MVRDCSLNNTELSTSPCNTLETRTVVPFVDPANHIVFPGQLRFKAFVNLPLLPQFGPCHNLLSVGTFGLSCLSLLYIAPRCRQDFALSQIHVFLTQPTRSWEGA